MKKFILAFVMSFMMCASVYAADQEVYIDQSGSNLDLDIDIIGCLLYTSPSPRD